MGTPEGSTEVLLDGVLDTRTVGEAVGWTDSWLLCVLVGTLEDFTVGLLDGVLVARRVGEALGRGDGWLLDVLVGLLVGD